MAGYWRLLRRRISFAGPKSETALFMGVVVLALIA
jgi:hypothetical protein